MIIYILLFLSLITPNYNNFYVDSSNSYHASGYIKVAVSLKDANKMATESHPDKVYSYNIKTRELKEMTVDTYSEIRIRSIPEPPIDLNKNSCNLTLSNSTATFDLRNMNCPIPSNWTNTTDLNEIMKFYNEHKLNNYNK